MASFEIRSPSHRRESTGVLIAMALVAAAALGWIRIAGSGTTAGPDLLPYQVVFPDLAGPDQRTFQQIQEGALEAENARTASGRWPEAAALAAEGVPPFAADPASAFAWTSWFVGDRAGYVGVPAAPEGRSWLLLFEEPPPGREQKNPDETHHRLAGGLMVHVTIWYRNRRPHDGQQILFPALDGWTQVLPSAPRAVAPRT